MTLIHLFSFSRLLLLVPLSSEGDCIRTITGEHLYLNELEHIFSTSLNQLLESSISRFIDSIPFTERSTGSLPTTAVSAADDENSSSENWTMDSFHFLLFPLSIHFAHTCLYSYIQAVLCCHIAQLRRARVLPTTVKGAATAATVVEKHIIEHYSLVSIFPSPSFKV